VIAIATAEGVPEQFSDDDLLAAAIRERGGAAERLRWDEPSVGWHEFDLVVIRSTWDYTWRLDEFLGWVDNVGSRLRNPPELIRWNTDKRYIADLAGAGVPVVETAFVDPGAPLPALEGEVVVKPTISGGGRNTGRFGPELHDQAAQLIEAIGASGRTAMVQPYLESVGAHGEAALAFIGGRFSHGLRKGAVLTGTGVAPTRDDALGAAEAMYAPDLVRPAEPDADELELAEAIVDSLGRRFGTPLYVRVDVARNGHGDPVVLELEAAEPNLYLNLVPGAAERLAEAIMYSLPRH
jgi:glutathione synthase/RimK-type ligase-like ATP-grasp enzyme